MLKQELADSGKDRSELLMIVDLERNDLNHVCEPGSVKVTEHFVVETYATVFHLVTEIIGKLREGLDVMDLIRAAFPGGRLPARRKFAQWRSSMSWNTADADSIQVLSDTSL